MGERRPRWAVWARRAAPWLVTAGALAFLLHRYALSDIVREIRDGRAGVLVGWAGITALASLALMSSADWPLIRVALGRLRLWDVVGGKAGSGVLAVVSYGVGQGGYGLWMARRTGGGARASIGVVLYIMLSDLTALCIIASATVWLTDLRLPGSAELAVRIAAPSAAAALVLAALLGPRVLARWARDPQLFRPWAAIPAGVYALSICTRVVSVTVGMVLTWAAARGFGLDVPLPVFLTYLPVIFFVGALPINLAGLGAVQIAWETLFRAYAPGEQIIAFQFLFSTLVAVMVVLRGLPFVARVLRDIDRGAP